MNAPQKWMVALGLLLLAAVQASAQTYDLSWFTIDGGGGTSSGGGYTVSGTIGQPDAGTMTGGNYTLSGGFWSVVAAVSTSGSPELTVMASGRSVIVSWPSAATGYSLQQSTSLDPTAWTAVSGTVSDDGTTKSIVLSPSSASMFYRLKN